MVVVHVRDDDILHLREIYTEPPQALRGRSQVVALAPLRGLLIESRVDDHRVPRVTRKPHEVVHLLGLVRVSADVVLRSATLHRGVPDRVDLERLGFSHWTCPRVTAGT